MKMWTEMRTAMMVARLGTVRAASMALGVHRATVTRHVDTLEQELGTKLFLRHRSGYTLTAEGNELRRLAESTERLMEGFFEDATLRKGTLSGTLTITGLPSMAHVVMPAIRAFCAKHSSVSVQYLAESELSRLELGHADIAVRSGLPPTNPDYVVVPFCKVDLGIFGHRKYLSEFGVPIEVEELQNHQFIGVKTDSGTVDVLNHLDIPTAALRFVTNDPIIALEALKLGIGLGVAASEDVCDLPDLLEVLPSLESIHADVWLVTHVDLHRNRLVQEMLQHLKSVI